MPTRSLATAFFVNTISVTKHVSQIRDALLVSAAKLPWLKCTGKNVTQHMRTILRVSVPQQSLEGAPPLADPLSSGQSGPVRHIGSGAEAVHATATACSHHGASKSVHWVLPASKKRARQVDSESEVEPEACSAEQKSPRPQGKKHAGPSSDPSQGDSLTSHGSQGCEGQPPAPHAEDDSLDDAIIPEHEWSTYMRSAPEMELHSLLQHVQ